MPWGWVSIALVGVWMGEWVKWQGEGVLGVRSQDQNNLMCIFYTVNPLRESSTSR